MMMTHNMEIMMMTIEIEKLTEWLQRLRRDGCDFEASKVEASIAEYRQRLSEFVSANERIEDDVVETQPSVSELGIADLERYPADIVKH
jgi:hypothetical protein